MRSSFYLSRLLFILILFLTSCSYDPGSRLRIDLAGEWSFRIDSMNMGEEKQWKPEDLNDLILLPGTMDENKKGRLNLKNDETSFLSRAYTYAGKAWYAKTVDIPENWTGKQIQLFLERTKPTKIWIDDKYIGENNDISISQQYDVTPHLTPGAHTIIILIDNGKSVPQEVINNSHAYTESTQTNWNGIIGDFYLEAMESCYLEDIQIYPNAENRKVRFNVRIHNGAINDKTGKISYYAEAWNTDNKHKTNTIREKVDLSRKEHSFELELGEDALLWDEFSPALYRLTVILNGKDKQEINFGLRHFYTEGTQFAINGRKTYLRGKHDACVFPLTAHVAMDVETWRHYFQVAKSYGINHYRFHSWCPPKACFEAADIEGIYLQPELPFWGGLNRKNENLLSFLKKEGSAIQKEYGNHASFVMFALGNELSGDLSVMEEFIETFRSMDSRHIYAFGSNNYLGFRGQLAGEDYLTTCRIGPELDSSFITHTRGSFSFADAFDGGYINHTYPNSRMDFSSAVALCSVPVISHETGQFQIYPNYEEMDKYTGVLEPRNFEVFRQRLIKTGMESQAYDFFMASGKWAVQLYRADIEMDLRTSGFGGFQLLDLQDYPGQGSAYVGILDAFMDSKGLIEPEEWKEFCNDVVPLFLIDKFCWKSDEKLSGDIQVFNYSEDDLAEKELFWELKNGDNDVLDSGTIPFNARQGKLTGVGNISPDISSVKKAEKVFLTLMIDGTSYKNSYPLWIYPEDVLIDETGILVTHQMDDQAKKVLHEGGNILWIPEKEKCKDVTVGGLFQTDYWNYRMFKSISEWNKKPVSPGTLGILTNPEHPVFKDFPTDFHTNWQWFSIIKNSYPMILDRLPDDYRPIVQVIDNIERNHKLGMIYEFKTDGGKLLICMADLQNAMDKPEARQLYSSMLQYMRSDDFRPDYSLSLSELNKLFSRTVTAERIKALGNVSYE